MITPAGGVAISGVTSVPQRGNRRTKMRLDGVVERGDQRMPLEHLLHDAALNALAATVNEPDLTQPGGVRRRHVFLDDRRHIGRCEGMKVDGVFDRDAVRHARRRRRWPSPPS
jgi:hypothetical protein